MKAFPYFKLMYAQTIPHRSIISFHSAKKIDIKNLKRNFFSLEDQALPQTIWLTVKVIIYGYCRTVKVRATEP